MTFRQSLTAFGDHVLDKALKKVEAGACFPSNGQLCQCLPYDPCAPLLQRILYSCYGNCTHWTGQCCG